MRIAGSGSVAWPSEALGRDEFVELVRREGARLHRDLPWRYIDDPYAVLVSEVMLQQTQVARVEKHWTRFLSLFPTIDSLAAAGTADVLAQWQGLGYNRRALALKRAAETCSAERGGLLPDTAEELETLPGIGPATAAGVMAFAYNRPSVYIETNVRTVFLHELFPDRDKVSDRELAPLVASTCPEDDARAWYYALLDYGAHLKTLVANPSRRSAHYARQSAFEGSRRQKRAELVRPSRASAPTSWPSASTPSSAPPGATAWTRPRSSPSWPTSCPKASSAERAARSSPDGARCGGRLHSLPSSGSGPRLGWHAVESFSCRAAFSSALDAKRYPWQS